MFAFGVTRWCAKKGNLKKQSNRGARQIVERGMAANSMWD
jgi:hypothetical protein